MHVMKTLPLGIMQGRLSPMEGEAMQFFPKNYYKEFLKAQDLGLDEIEAVFAGADGFGNAMLSDPQGFMQAVYCAKLKMKSVLADYFIKYPLSMDNAFLLSYMLMQVRLAGGELVEVPFIENSAINEKTRQGFIDALSSCRWTAQASKCRIAIETDLPPEEVLSFIKDANRDLNNPVIGANYDTGNSAALGYDMEKELDILGPYIFNIHIKDRPLGGKTCPLGTGAVDFPKFFRKLKQIGYKGSLILQAARSLDGDEMKCVEGQMEFVKKHLEAAWTSD